MKNSYHSYHYKNSLLMAVPAVHHHTAFANQVHLICRDPQQRPDAIAVETGHNLVLELVRFLRELKQGSCEKVFLPCMLGIIKNNRFIHPGQSDKALLLQEFYRSPLYNLPDHLLSDRLNFSKRSTLFISPSDSIIEAVRCAIELDIPIYGVDLSDFASTKKQNISFEDTQCAHNNMLEYGDRVMKYCSAERDLHIDVNRETVMAAGLKYCLTKYRRVLFTCGMAHWGSIVSLLENNRIHPFPVHEIPGESEFQRVIVHPSLAAPVMEIIPQITIDYEKKRYPVTAKTKNINVYKPERLIRNCLDSVYKEYTTPLTSEILESPGSVEWSDIANYEQYLFNLSSVRQRKIPDLATMLASAKVMMDNDFCRILILKVMKVNPDWASPKDFPNLPVIESEAKNQKESMEWRTNQKVRIISGIEDENTDGIQSVPAFYTNVPLLQALNANEISEYWEWIHKKKNKHKQPSEGNPWIWPPCESLIYGLAFKAAEISNTNKRRFNQSSAFEGSLEGGVDVKATIRSIIRSERKIYVSKLASDIEQSILDGINPDPFVLLFSDGSDNVSGQFGFFTAGSELEEFAKDPHLFNKIARENGRVFVSSVVLEEKVAPPSHLSALVAEMSKTHGTVMFGNPCINARQSASWLESANYKCCPILFEHNMSSLTDYYSKNYYIQFNLSDWKETLIRMAIPFAKKMVTILASDSFQIPERARIEASRKRILLNQVGLSNFSESQLNEAQHRISIPTLDRAGIHFPPEAEILLGHAKDKYFEMLPYAMRKQVGYTEFELKGY